MPKAAISDDLATRERKGPLGPVLGVGYGLLNDSVARGIVANVTVQRRWLIESTEGMRTRTFDASKRYGQRRTYELTTQLTLILEIDDCQWRAYYDIAATHGRPTLRGIRIVPVDESEPPNEPPPRTLFVPGAALDEIRAGLPILGDSHVRAHGISDLHSHRPARNEHYLYAVIASVYAESCERGSRRPGADVADWLKREWPGAYSPRSVPNMIGKARQRKVLTDAPRPNIPGGTLTDLGREVLANGPPLGYEGPELPI